MAKKMKIDIFILGCLLCSSFVSTSSHEAGDNGHHHDDLAVSAHEHLSKIEPGLLIKLEDSEGGGRATFVVQLKHQKHSHPTNQGQGQSEVQGQGVDAANNSSVITARLSHGVNHVTDFLKREKARREQEDVEDGLFSYRSLFGVNKVIIKEGDLKLAKRLAQFHEVAHIKPYHKHIG